MDNPSAPHPFTRREFLGHGVRGLGLIAFSGFAPAFLTSSLLAGHPPPEKDRTILVLVQLAGGNDGLNTLVPIEDDRYYRLRPKLAIPRTGAIRIRDDLGLHPRMTAFRDLHDRGQLAMLLNVGYPNPNRSHFRSSEIWESAADSDDFLPTGWIGRFLDHTCSGVDSAVGPAGVHLTTEMPQTFLGEQPHATFGLPPQRRAGRRRTPDRTVERALIGAVPETDHPNLIFLKQTMLDAIVTDEKIQTILSADRSGAAYPGTPLARSLRNIAALIRAGLPTRVYFASLSGFDTHSNQAGTHATLLATLTEAMAAFQSDLEACGVADQVLTMTFSEFGRRPAENSGGGTDHGTAAPLFVMGSRIQPGIHGSPPDLEVDARSDLRHGTDFRGIYARILDRWLDCPSEAVLGARFAAPEFI